MDQQASHTVPRVLLGRTPLAASRIGLSGQPFGLADPAQNWDPFSLEGYEAAVATVRASIDAGLNFIDTSPTYGNGQSDTIIGKAIEGRRDQVILSTRVSHQTGGVGPSLDASLRRLRTDCIDIAQFHAVAYKPEDVRRIFNEGPLDAMDTLRERGKVRFIGFSVEMPATCRPLIASVRFDIMRVRYNLIDQSAAMQVLDEARQTELGVIAAGALTGGVFQKIAQALAPDWQRVHPLDEVALKFVLSDSRVDVALLELCSPEEAGRYAALAAAFKPTLDVAHLSHLSTDGGAGHPAAGSNADGVAARA